MSEFLYNLRVGKVLSFFGGGPTHGIWRFPATATQDPSGVCDLHQSSWQGQIFNPLSEARDRTRNLMVPSRIRFCSATTGTPQVQF